MQKKRYISELLLFILSSSLPVVCFGQASGTLRGTVTLETSGTPAHGASVTILQLKRTVDADDNGVYEFQNVPPGAYDVVARMDKVPDQVQKVLITSDGGATANFQMRLRVVGEQVSVSATGSEEVSPIAPVTTLTSVELVEKNTQSLGDVLQNELGVAKRTFGPGTSRPVIRGFDGARVLVLQDGNRIGTLGFQSGDHGETIDLLNLDRVEIVKGPATLLYGSNAMGGVVNAIGGHESAHEGLRAFLTALGSTNNWQGGGGGGLEYGTKNWLFWGNGAGQRAGDYDTPIGRITNSYTKEGAGSGGFGYYPGKQFFSFDYSVDRRRYGIPFDPSQEDPEVVFLNPRRNGIRFSGGVRDLASRISGAQLSLHYNDYMHQEINAVDDVVNTESRTRLLPIEACLISARQVDGRGVSVFGDFIATIHRPAKKLSLHPQSKTPSPHSAFRRSILRESPYSLAGASNTTVTNRSKE